MTSGLSMISWPQAFKSHSYHRMALLQKVWTILGLSIIRHLSMHKKQKLHILPVYEIALADAFYGAPFVYTNLCKVFLHI